MHHSQFRYHGNLKAGICLIDRHFTLKIGCLGDKSLEEFFGSVEHTKFRTAWKDARSGDTITQKQQLGHPPVCINWYINRFEECLDTKQHRKARSSVCRMRDRFKLLLLTCQDKSGSSFDLKEIRHSLNQMLRNRKPNVVEIIFARVATNAENLEVLVYERTIMLQAERAKADFILQEILFR